MHRKHLSLFKAYAEAFELTLEDNDWARLVPYFADGAEYLPGDGKTLRGRESVIDFLHDSVNSLDRKFDLREFSRPPDFRARGAKVTMNFAISYTKRGLPALEISGREVANFAAGRIIRLEDFLDKESVQHLDRWLAEHGSRL